MPIAFRFLCAAEKVDLVAFLQSHVGFLPLRQAPGVSAHAANFSEITIDPHLQNLHLKQRLNGMLDLDLVGVRPDAEQDLIVFLREQAAFLGYERRLNDFLRLSHAANLSSISRSTCSVMMRCS